MGLCLGVTSVSTAEAVLYPTPHHEAHDYHDHTYLASTQVQNASHHSLSLQTAGNPLDGIAHNFLHTVVLLFGHINLSQSNHLSGLKGFRGVL